MNIEQRFAEAIRAFSLDALAGALSPQRRPRRRAGPCWPTPSAPRCVAACPATPRRFLSTGGVILNTAARSSSGSTGGPTHRSRSDLTLQWTFQAADERDREYWPLLPLLRRPGAWCLLRCLRTAGQG